MMQSAWKLWWNAVECLRACNDGCLTTGEGTIEKFSRSSGRPLVRASDWRYGARGFDFSLEP